MNKISSVTIKNNFIKIHEKLKSRFWLYTIFKYILMSLLTNFIVEALNQRSVSETFAFVKNSPLVFVSGFLIIFAGLAVLHLLKKRKFWTFFWCLAWICVAIISHIMYSFRLMPFSFNDLLLLPTTFTVLPRYLSLWQVCLIALAVVLLVWFLVHIYKRTRSEDVDVKKNLVLPILTVFLCVIYLVFSHAYGVVDKKISGLYNKYTRNGFVYCFSSSVMYRGMTQPDNYSSSQVASIVRNVTEHNSKKEKKANIIFLQLESFFDVNNITGLSYSKNPIPVFTSLEDKFSHGYLDVPTFSAGTANTEFEVISGMSVDYFGIGEVAYRTIVADVPIETSCHVLKRHGYSTHAIHNNEASFYNRKHVYTNIGFDTFTSLEYMYGTEYNPLGWAKDKALITSIDDCLNSTGGVDFIYAVGVQSHGTYPDDMTDYENAIEVEGIDDPSLKNRYEYYLSQIYEVDAFVGDLIKVLKKNKEPTVLVVFGDHMPGFELEEYQLSNGSKYQTEYVMWSNFGMDCIKKDLQSYQLYSYVLDRLNIEGGVMSKLHRRYSYALNDEYRENFEIIQYDMIEGEGISYDGERPESVATKMGVRTISVNNAKLDGTSLVVYGENFNEFSKITLDGEVLETEFSDDGKLMTNNVKEDLTGDICVSQVDKASKILSSSNSIKLE